MLFCCLKDKQNRKKTDKTAFTVLQRHSIQSFTACSHLCLEESSNLLFSLWCMFFFSCSFLNQFLWMTPVVLPPKSEFGLFSLMQWGTALTLCCLPDWISSSVSSPCLHSVTHYPSERCYHPNHPPTRSLSLNDTADSITNLLGCLPCTTLYSVLSLQLVCKVHDERTVCFIVLPALLTFKKASLWSPKSQANCKLQIYKTIKNK